MYPFKNDGTRKFATFFQSSGHGDDDEGFYAVYRKLFNQIHEEDLPFREDDADDDCAAHETSGVMRRRNS